MVNGEWCLRVLRPEFRQREAAGRGYYSPFTIYDLLVAVFDDGGLGHVDRELADVRDVVGDALQMFGDEE